MRGIRRPGGRIRLPVLMAILSFAAVACGAGSDGGGDAVLAPPAATSEAAASGGDLPGAEFELADGTTATFADFLDGRPLVVNFFASWCPPCRAEMPDFQAVFADVEDEVNFLGFALQDSHEAAAALVETTGVSYPWAPDPDGQLYVAFGGFAMPTTVYISPAGEVLGTDSGALTEGQLRDRLGDLFGVDA